VLQDPSLQPVENRIHHFAVEHLATAVSNARVAKGGATRTPLAPEVVGWAVLALFRENVSNHGAAPPHEVTARILCDLAVGGAGRR
jgi:hypothetical protein